jgi:hypothetical protein
MKNIIEFFKELFSFSDIYFEEFKPNSDLSSLWQGIIVVLLLVLLVIFLVKKTATSTLIRWLIVSGVVASGSMVYFGNFYSDHVFNRAVNGTDTVEKVFLVDLNSQTNKVLVYHFSNLDTTDHKQTNAFFVNSAVEEDLTAPGLFEHINKDEYYQKRTTLFISYFLALFFFLFTVMVAVILGGNSLTTFVSGFKSGKGEG